MISAMMPWLSDLWGGGAVTIEPASLRDAPKLAQLHGASFHRGWGEAEFEQMLAERNTLVHRLRIGRRIVGFAASRLAADEAEILSIAVAASHRGRGLSRNLLLTHLGHLAGRGVDVVLDMVGGPYLDRNVATLALEGRIVILATQGGRTGQIDIGKLMMKRARVMGSTMRARSAAEKGKVAERLLRDVWPMLPDRKNIWPVVDSVYPLRDAALAHKRMEGGEHIGKIVLTP